MSYPTAEPHSASPLRCPKCAGVMRTYERNGVHVEQCDTCRGIFLDFGELEALTQLEARMIPPPPPAYPQPAPGYQQVPPSYQQQVPPGYGPGWGTHSGHRYRRGGFGGLFFSS